MNDPMNDPKMNDPMMQADSYFKFCCSVNLNRKDDKLTIDQPFYQYQFQFGRAQFFF